MGVRLTIGYSDIIAMKDLKDGQIAEVIDSNYNGILVQRYKDYGVAIGKTNCNSWTDIQKNNLKVRVLDAGELIEIL
jgi:hypothetical protein